MVPWLYILPRELRIFLDEWSQVELGLINNYGNLLNYSNFRRNYPTTPNITELFPM